MLALEIFWRCPRLLWLLLKMLVELVVAAVEVRLTMWVETNLREKEPLETFAAGAVNVAGNDDDHWCCNYYRSGLVINSILFLSCSCCFLQSTHSLPDFVTSDQSVKNWWWLHVKNVLLTQAFLYDFEKPQPWTKNLKKCARKKLGQILPQNSTYRRFFFTKNHKKTPCMKKMLLLLPKLKVFPWNLNALKA